ncbi:FAD/NAD(P)-binding domain-containing protein [Cryphonectria parasitica EP155]|uniref:FAD/NAD(P)-binding domain-containing protein n=1 Tax=Cryphonectria parasitica (strain ATCC 38755 / EP155) TaxID=660469 RepID=A0A9P5CK77_CRYP1|nr:FAD/NAD(P)-binding domain-containing protein [Cryphonectria parasitica EP155]KAF3761989.1 FAD/NAD(P)-binding domain-containing protein [Cryphonectria parasitica EP155]
MVGDSISGEAGAPFRCKEEPIENERPLKVRVIGAGLSGVYLGIRIPQRLRNIDFKIYEKNGGIGGTWWENRYPGCACDIPAHSYQFTFEPNKAWSGFYATSTEICKYIDGVAEKYGAKRFVQLHHEVVDCTWVESLKQWRVTVHRLDTKEDIVETVDIVVTARGSLNKTKWPQIPGIDDFEGEKMHSSAWNEKYDFRNKKIAVIGGGSSSIQIVPELQKVDGAQLHVFVRNKTWIINRFGDYIMGQMGWDTKDLEISDERKAEWEESDEAYLKFRKLLDDDGNFVHFSSLTGSDMQRTFIETFSKVTQDRLLNRPDLLDVFSPPFGVGCRRITPGPGYLEALCEPNVNLVTRNIEVINKTGLVVEGRQIDADVLVCATGFDTSCIPGFTVVGRNGVTIADKFAPFPKSYLSLAVDGFPNYFMMLGPNSGIAAGSLNPVLEAEGDYIIKCIRKLQKEDYLTMAPKKARVEDFSDLVGEYFKRTVYMDECKSWYKTEGGTGGRISALWPGSMLHLLEALRAPRWEDFDFEAKDQNRLRWLGNGFSVCLTGGGDPSFYLNPDVVDVPPAGTPEMDLRYKARPFSH